MTRILVVAIDLVDAPRVVLEADDLRGLVAFVAKVSETEPNRVKVSPGAENGAGGPYRGPDGQRDLTPQQYAQATGLHVQTVYGWCQDGRLGEKRAGRWHIPAGAQPTTPREDR